MMLTIPPVVYAIFRYLYLIYDRNDDRSMSGIVAGDRGIQAAGAAWASSPSSSSTSSKLSSQKRFACSSAYGTGTPEWLRQTQG